RPDVEDPGVAHGLAASDAVAAVARPGQERDALARHGGMDDAAQGELLEAWSLGDAERREWIATVARRIEEDLSLEHELDLAVRGVAPRGRLILRILRHQRRRACAEQQRREDRREQVKSSHRSSARPARGPEGCTSGS